MKKILIIISVLILLCSCFMKYETIPVRLSDSRLNGRFSYYERKEGFTEKDGFDSKTWVFDGTNKCHYRHKCWFWNGSYGWAISGDYKGDAYEFDYEIEIKDNQYIRHRLWDSKYSEWSDWQKYEFIDADTLRIYSQYGTDSYDDYTRSK